MVDRTVFVGRERELGQLEASLELALQGAGRVCFISGEAGTGKTALVTEFAKRAQDAHDDLVVAFGQCNMHSGMGDPYLPFREILHQLTGDVEGELARGTTGEENAKRLRHMLSLSGRALAEVGPDLIGLFVPGAGLVARLAAFAAEEVEWVKKLQGLAGRHQQAKVPAASDIDQSHILEQYANVLQRLAKDVPLILVLDDLHWTDAASAELLFHLGRRIRESRLLVVGTYRPDEIELGRFSPSTGEPLRHPMEKTINELKRYYGEIRIALGNEEAEERRRFVNAFLDTEANELGDDFRSALLAHTAGHALFTIELLRDMQERGDLVRDRQGRWVEGPELDWDDLPPRVEGVIEERIGRLSHELREELTVASVEGEDFTAEVIARVQETNARQLFRRFSRELEKRHRLIQTQGVRQVNDQRLFLFRFSHNLFQVYLYNELSKADQMCLHEDVGNALEALYGDRVDEIPTQLARHFEEAGIPDKASHYLYLAGEQAAARYANTEALGLYSRALDLLTEDQMMERGTLLLARERVLDLLGQRDAQEDDLGSLAELAQHSGDDRLRAETHLRLARYRGVTGDLDGAVDAAREAIRLAEQLEDVYRAATGHLEWARALHHQADYDQAQFHLEKALALARAQLAREPRRPESTGEMGRVALRLIEAESLRGLALIHTNRGHTDQATTLLEEARELYREAGHRGGECKLLSNLANLQKNQGDHDSARDLYLEALALAQEIGDRHSEGGLLSNLGTTSDYKGDFVQSIAYHEAALRVRREIDDLRGQAISLGNLGVISGRRNDHTGARRRFEEALAIFRQIGDRWGTALTVNNLAGVCLYLGDYETAVSHTLEAGEVFGQIDYPRGAASAESMLGFLFYLRGQADVSVTHCRRALAILEEIGELEHKPEFLIHLGDALVGIDDLPAASDAFGEALGLLRANRAAHDVVKPLAGLARVALAEGDPVRALDHVEALLPHLAAIDDPYGAYLTCYHVLRANGDGRAGEILATAHRLLMENAAMLSDEDSRRSFLENVRVNREIVAEIAQLNDG